MTMFLDKYGVDKLIFGSDFPFGTPYSELRKVRDLKLPDEDFEKVVSGNIIRLIKPLPLS